MAAAVIALAACAPMEPPVSSGPGDQPIVTLPPVAAPSPPPVPAPETDEPNPLVSTLWNLVGYGQPGALTRPLTDTLATLDIDDERMAGSTGCNFYSFTYTADGQALTLAEPGPVMTLMACPEPLMQQETDFLRVMSAVTGYTLDGGQLTLTGAEGVLVFEAAQSLPLAGTAWQLNGIAQNDAVVSTYVDEQITLTLDEGRASGFAGCNDYFGAYEITGNGLKFSALGSTKKACEGDPSQREMEFLAAFESVAGFRIERDQLTLLDSGGNPVMMFVALAAQ
jgi:heat shock protein HslJ